jgi:hypothetical protein
MPKDVLLAEAHVLWEYDGGQPDDHPAVRVVGPGDPPYLRYICSWGACNLDFQQADDHQKLIMLFQQFRDMTLDGINPQDIHAAFQQIPEYRAATHPSLIAAAYDETYR